MRSILLGDIVALARALLAVPAGERPALARRTIAEAHMAHHVFKRFGRPHATWGNGSLMARANGLPQRREPFADDPDYLAALREVIEALLANRAVAVTAP